jgi:nitroreductase
LPLITAARLAPSAVNTQPWRFLWRQGELSLFVRHYNPKYGRNAGQAYRFYDAGICMANIKLAMQALEMRGCWILYEKNGLDIPNPPAELQPIARLRWDK